MPPTLTPRFLGMHKLDETMFRSWYTNFDSIGERNGITPLGGLMARMIVADRDYVMGKYKYVISSMLSRKPS